MGDWLHRLGGGTVDGTLGRSAKRERRRLAAEEERARQQARAQASPVTREQLDEIFERVALRVFHEGHDSSFAHTIDAVRALGIEADAVTSFLHSQRVHSDWDVLVEADPCRLFGPTSARLARMPIAHAELHELLDWLDLRLSEEPCSNELSLTRIWLEEKDLPVETTAFALIAQGGGCDCEVVLNVECGRIYPDTIAEGCRDGVLAVERAAVD